MTSNKGSYSTISKLVGHDRPQIQVYPNRILIERLITDAPNNAEAFKELFTYNRFLRSPSNEEEIQILDRILEGIQISEKNYR